MTRARSTGRSPVRPLDGRILGLWSCSLASARRPRARRTGDAGRLRALRRGPLAGREGARRLPRDVRRGFPRGRAGSQDHRADEASSPNSCARSGSTSTARSPRSASSAGARSRRNGPQPLRPWSGPTGCRGRSSSASGAWRPISARFTGSIYVVRALATLAYTRYRGDFFREELLTALQILGSRTISTATRCSAPGPAPWVRPSSCRRVS